MIISWRLAISLYLILSTNLLIAHLFISNWRKGTLNQYIRIFFRFFSGEFLVFSNKAWINLDMSKALEESAKKFSLLFGFIFFCNKNQEINIVLIEENGYRAKEPIHERKINLYR